MLAAVLFLLIVPDNAPAFRAAVMCFAYCGAFLFRRNSNPLNSLALAAIVLLFINPGGLFEADWQLSFATVLGIFLLADTINIFFQETTSIWFFELNRQLLHVRLFIRFVSLSLSAFSVSLAAWLTSAGILLYHFNAIQVFTSFWTILASPIILLDSILGYSKLIITLLLPSVAAVMGMAIHFITDWLIKFIRAIAGLGISEIVIGKTSIAVIVLYYALIVYAAFFNFKYRLVRKAVLATAISIFAILLILPNWLWFNHQSLTVTILNVGHGQAILAQLPDNTNILFDSGSLTRSDAGTRIIAPFLRYKGIRKVKALVISHGDIDHINGILEVANNCHIESVYASNAFYEDNRQTTRFLRDELEQKHITAKDINCFSRKADAASMKVLWPEKDILENKGISDNDKSIVTAINLQAGELSYRQILRNSPSRRFSGCIRI
jgi:competence protein ComEC